MRIISLIESLILVVIGIFITEYKVFKSCRSCFIYFSEDSIYQQVHICLLILQFVFRKT